MQSENTKPKNRRSDKRKRPKIDHACTQSVRVDEHDSKNKTFSLSTISKSKSHTSRFQAVRLPCANFKTQFWMCNVQRGTSNDKNLVTSRREPSSQRKPKHHMSMISHKPVSMLLKKTNPQNRFIKETQRNKQNSVKHNAPSTRPWTHLTVHNNKRNINDREQVWRHIFHHAHLREAKNDRAHFSRSAMQQAHERRNDQGQCPHITLYQARFPTNQIKNKSPSQERAEGSQPGGDYKKIHSGIHTWRLIVTIAAAVTRAHINLVPIQILGYEASPASL